MKSVRNYYSVFLIVVLFVLAVPAQNGLSEQDESILNEFERRARAYAKFRERIEDEMPQLPKKATAEQIQAHKISFQKNVQAARQRAAQGEIFTPDAARVLRMIIASEFRGAERQELRKKVFEAENKGVPVKVNVVYPESNELMEMPPTLLLALPQLPKQIRYRFVGTSLLLVDRENNLIVDYMTNAIPATNAPTFTTASAQMPVVTTQVSAPAVSPAMNATAPAVRPAGPPITLPLREGSLRMAVFGDAGRGTKDQYDLGKVMLNFHNSFPFDTVLMTGDNIYGPDSPADMKLKFEDVYRPLIDRGVKFYGSLGNHDNSNQRFYALFNMNGEEYYRLDKNGVSFYALNSNYLDKRQLDWFTVELGKDPNKWRVAFFHHPPYSSGGRHGSDEKVREVLHPLFVKNGVDLVFTGHDHFYERIKPQDGITYFVAGAAGKIRKGDIKERSPITASGFDADLSFMLVEITGDEMHFQVISKAGKTVDSGVIKRRD